MSLWHRILPPTLKNTGSTARDHLASERTFLAWLRTGLGFIALGIAIERFSQLDIERLLATYSTGVAPQKQQDTKRSQHERRDHSLVGALLGTGGGSIAYGTQRYFANMRALQRGLYKPAVYGAGSMSLAVTGLAGAVAWATLK